MSVYYCSFCGKHHDNDWTPCVEHPNGSNDLTCEHAAATIEEERYEAMMPNNHVFTAAQQVFINKMESEDIGEGI
jgi:hypothetical protein